MLKQNLKKLDNMKITVNIKEDHLDMLYKASIGDIGVSDETFKVDWTEYSNYVKGYITVQIEYDLYVQLTDVSNGSKETKES